MNIIKNLKFEKIVFLILFFSVIILSETVKADYNKVLIVCKNESEIEGIKNLVLACEKDPVIVQEIEYNNKMLEDISLLITTSMSPYSDAKVKNISTICIGSEFSKVDNITFKKVTNTNVSVSFHNYYASSIFEKELYIIDDASSKNDFGQVTTNININTPFSISVDNFTYVPYYRKEGLPAIMLGDIIQSHFDNKNTGKMYVLVDKIYPFSNLGRLCTFADLMYENGIPFIVRSMPVYDNLNYPAFLKYAQVLQYVQAKNGTIVLHEPIIKENEPEIELLETKTARFKKVLAENNIYDIDMKYVPYRLKFDEFMNIKSNKKNFGQLPINTMIELPNIEDINDVIGLIEQLNNRWITVSDYKRTFTNDNFQYNEITIDENFIYFEEHDGEFKSFFSKGNKILIIVIGISLIIFIGLIFIGNKAYKKKFLNKL